MSQHSSTAAHPDEALSLLPPSSATFDLTGHPAATDRNVATPDRGSKSLHSHIYDSASSATTLTPPHWKDYSRSLTSDAYSALSKSLVLTSTEEPADCGQGRPLLTPQSSILLPPKSVIFTHSKSSNIMVQGVDESIYHWKVLNLSRAKLKASSRTSALLSGFAMVAMVEINIEKDVPVGLLIMFAVCTVLLIAVHMLALMISTCILPNVEAVSNLHFQTHKTVFESPHIKMNFIVELAWAFSTVLGILLFLVEIAILSWVKFYTVSHIAAWTATGMLIPIVIIFIAFAAMFYLKLVSHKSEVYEDNIMELQAMKDNLECENTGDESTALAGHDRSPSHATKGAILEV